MERDIIYHKDCFDGIREIPDKSIDLIVTDPPYDVSTSGGRGSLNTKKKFDVSLKELKDGFDITEGYDIDSFADEVVRVQPSVNAYFFCNKLQIPQYFKTYVERLGCKFEILCWHKNNALPSYSNKYLSDTEYCLYFRKGGYCMPNSYENAQTYWIRPINADDKKLYGHPTIKPIEIIQRLVANSSKEGGLVLDPFMGSGTTAIACLMEKRHFIGYELDPRWHKVANERIKDYKSQLTLF